MPSTQIFPQSGGIRLISGDVFSGTGFPAGGIQIYLDTAAPGPIYIGLPWFSGGAPAASGVEGGVTITSGGSLSSGGLQDGFKLTAGRDFFIPRVRLYSGISSIRIGAPAASSGGIIFWEHL